MFLTVCNIRNRLAMTIIFSVQTFKIWCSYEKWNKKSRKKFLFSDNCIGIGSGKILQSWTGYLSSAVNVLRNTTKISRNTREDIFQINFRENDEKTWKKCSHGDFASILVALTCWMSKRALKWRFLESGLTKIFTVCNFGNTLAMTMVLLFKRFKIWFRLQKWNTKLRKSFSLFREFHLNWEWQILAMLNAIFVIGRQWVNKHPEDFTYH